MSSISPLQCLLARTALGWTSERLARESDLGINTVTRFERGESPNIRATTREAMQNAFEAAGIVFLADGAHSLSGGEGVRLAGKRPLFGGK